LLRSEAQIEVSIVSDQNCAFAASLAHLLAYFAEYTLKRIAFRDSRAQWMMWIDAGYLQRGGFKVSPLERLYMETKTFFRMEQSLVVEIDEYRRDFEQGVCPAVEATRFQIDHDGQKPSKSLTDGRSFAAAVCTVQLPAPCSSASS
jgi:hypothetical protein